MGGRSCFITSGAFGHGLPPSPHTLFRTMLRGNFCVRMAKKSQKIQKVNNPAPFVNDLAKMRTLGCNMPLVTHKSLGLQLNYITSSKRFFRQKKQDPNLNIYAMLGPFTAKWGRVFFVWLFEKFRGQLRAEGQKIKLVHIMFIMQGLHKAWKELYNVRQISKY